MNMIETKQIPTDARMATLGCKATEGERERETERGGSCNPSGGNDKSCGGSRGRRGCRCGAHSAR